MKNLHVLLAGVAILLLAGCGDRDGDDVATTADSFISTVRQTIATAPDNTEPVTIDSVVATAPETTEPEPL